MTAKLPFGGIPGRATPVIICRSRHRWPCDFGHDGDRGLVLGSACRGLMVGAEQGMMRGVREFQNALPRILAQILGS